MLIAPRPLLSLMCCETFYSTSSEYLAVVCVAVARTVDCGKSTSCIFLLVGDGSGVRSTGISSWVQIRACVVVPLMSIERRRRIMIHRRQHALIVEAQVLLGAWCIS